VVILAEAPRLSEGALNSAMVSAQNVGGKPTLVRDDLTRMDARFFFPLAFDEPNPFLPETFDQSDCNK
jgi:hypothetical protein